jgi:hypothetical protein
MFATLLEKVSFGTPSAFRNLTLTPILLKDGPLSSVEPLCLEEALAAGTLRVSEVSAEGHVPELRVRNTGDAPVLILDGEELVGAKQNRIVNVTILVAPLSDVVIPVSLWNGVDKMLYALGAASPTRALSDGFENRANVIADYLAAFAGQPGQVGVIYRIGGVLAGLDLFGSERTFARALPKLVRGSALQALAGYEEEGRPSLDEPQFLRTALTAPADRFPAVGLGGELRIDTEKVGGGALEIEGGLVHLFAFSRRSNDGRNEGRAAS